MGLEEVGSCDMTMGRKRRLRCGLTCSETGKHGRNRYDSFIHDVTEFIMTLLKLII